MNTSRRGFLTLVGKTMGVAAAVVAFPRITWASWNKKAFTATELDKAISLKFPGLTAQTSDKITLKAPEIAENGGFVPVKVKTTLPNVTNISLFVEKNPSPLSASFNLSPINVVDSSDVAVRLRMANTSNLIAMVVSDGKLYKVVQEVKVTIGGCGG